MSRRTSFAALLLALGGLAGVARPAIAQTSTGTITGVVKDPSGAIVPGALVTLTSSQTGFDRHAQTDASGRYTAAFLGPDTYVVCGRVPSMASPVRKVLVQAGMALTVDLTLDVRPLAEDVTVTPPLRARDNHHGIGGWIDQQQIDSQPFNGRNVLELVKVEPGIPAPVRLSGGRTFIAPLGAGLQTIPRAGFTRTTVDGASIETPGTVGTLLQISPQTVDQLQVSTANFDIAAGLATSGVVDVVTRSGGNRFQGSAFSLYRDPRWSSAASALPGAVTSSPSFRRVQTGATAGGPFRTDRAFYFAGYERHDQRDVIVIPQADAALGAFAGTFSSPYQGTLFSGRVDLRISDRHHVFLRHSHDTNAWFASPSAVAVPSAWSYQPVRAHQTIAALTSVLGTRVVNDMRASLFVVRTSQHPASLDTCGGPCLGLGAVSMSLTQGGPNVLTIGDTARATNDSSRFAWSDAVVLQRGAHGLRLGVDWEYTQQTRTTDNGNTQLTLWAPEAVRSRAPGVAIPASFMSAEDLLQLPLRSFAITVGSATVLQRGFDPVRRFSMFRAYVADAWSVSPRISVNAGAAWSIEPGALNHDLTKPGWLTPLVGVRGLQAPATEGHLAGTIGVAWNLTGDGRTIVRAGTGRYVESVARTVTLNLWNERTLLSPLGTGQISASGSNLIWNGSVLDFRQPTAFTGNDLLAILPAIQASLAASLNPENRDFSLRNLDKAKEGRNLYDASYTSPRAVHASVGIERAVGDGVVVSADVAWKRFSHTFINGIDYNRFFSAAGPVIPACTAAQRSDPLAACSNGSLFFDTTSGRARYAGLLVRAEKRMSRWGRILGSYAFGSFVGSNGTGTGTSENPDGRVFGFNNDDWMENYGPLATDIRHVLNVSGQLAAPGRFDVSFNVSAYGRAPFSAYVAGMDFNGDGTSNDLLPGTRVNQFNRGLNRGDLVRLVGEYNATYAGRPTAVGQIAPAVTLPDNLSFNDHFFTLDVRVARTAWSRGPARLSVFVEVFNAFNTMNLAGYSGNLSSPLSFGQPTSRVGQAFGSGGPRSAQVGVRAIF